LLLRIWYLLTGSVCFILILVVGKAFLFPLVLSLFLAALLTPAVRYFSRKRIPEWLSTFALLSALILFFVLALVFFVTRFQPIFQDLTEFKLRFSEVLENLHSLLEKYPFVAEKWLQPEKLEQWIEPFLSGFFDLFISGLNFSLTFFVNLILILFYTYFIVLYRRNIKAGLYALTPDAYDQPIHRFLEEGLYVVRRYTGGVLMVIGILFLLLSLGLWVLQIPHPLFWAFLGAVLNIVPYVGIFSVATVASLYTGILTFSLWKGGLTFGCYWLVHVLEANWITPYLVGSRIHLNPLAILVGMVFSYEVWGIQGMLVVLPCMALVRVATKHFSELTPLEKWLGASV